MKNTKKRKGKKKMDELQAIKVKQEKSTAIVKSGEVNTESLIAKAIESNVPIETMERLLAMRTQLKEEAAREAFQRDFANMQSELSEIQKTKIVKDKAGKKLYSYAPLESIIKQTKGVIAKYGFSYDFDTENSENGQSIKIICAVSHVEGFTKKKIISIPIDKGYMTEIQKTGSTITYGKRYCFCNAFGIMTGDEDTDANVGAPDTNEPVDIPPAKPKAEKPKEAKKPENTSLNLARESAKKALRAAFEKSDVKGTELEFLAAVMASVGEKDLKGKKFEDLTEQEYWAVRKCALNW